MKLYIVYLGGSAPNANIELHDIQFVIGDKIEDTYKQLQKQWFGTAKGLHIDSYKELAGADGYKIEIKDYPQNINEKLYFVNLGGYQKDKLSELHEFGLFVCKSKEEAKKKAMTSLLENADQKHKDNLYSVDDCIILDTIGSYHVHLSHSQEKFDLTPDWYGYNVISHK